MKMVQERMTPNRLALLRSLEGVEWADALAAKGVHMACYRLGWIETVWKLEDGRILKATQFEAERPLGTRDRFADIVDMVGFALTEDGREALRKFDREQKTKSRDWLILRPRRPTVRTPDFDSGNCGSNPHAAANADGGDA